MFGALGNKMWLENAGNSVHAKNVWENKVNRKEISPSGRDLHEMGVQVVPDAQEGDIMTFSLP